MTAFTTSRRVFTTLAASTALALLGTSFSVGAAEHPFTQAAFDKALASGEPLVVDFAASWCPTCKAQKPVVDALMKEPKRQSLTLLKADYDTETALKKRLNVAQQSTFVVFKGGKEVGRSTGQTDRTEIAQLFDKAL